MKSPTIVTMIEQQLDLDPTKDYSAADAAVEVKRAAISLRDRAASMPGTVVRVNLASREKEGIFLQITTREASTAPESPPKP